MVEHILAQATAFGSRFFCADKGTREALLRNSCHIYNPSKPPFEKGGLWQVSHLLTYGEHILSTHCSRLLP